MPRRAAAVDEPRAGTLEYRFSLDIDLATLRARVCPVGRLPSRLVPGAPNARALLRYAAIERGASLLPLAADANGIVIAGLRAGDCVRYDLDLDAGRSGFGGLEVWRAGASRAVNTALYVWRPTDYPEYAQAFASFELPSDVDVSVPWPAAAPLGDAAPFVTTPANTRYTLDHSAFAFHAYSAFGKLTRSQVRIGTSVIDVAELEGFTPAEHASIGRWVDVQANAVAALAGQLPRKRIQLVVLPVGPSSEPVRFGSMTRGGGASAAVLLSNGFDESALMRDWVLVHELCHLVHPFVMRRDAWLSEGLATYYQEVLRVRAGLHKPEDAWRRLLEGSRKGEAMRDTLAHTAANMFKTFAFSPVYWAGAAFALRADVELRKRSQGKRSLDDAIDKLTRCCSRGDRAWPASDVIERLDAISGEPVMRELAAKWVDGPRFPELKTLFAELGIDDQGRPIEGAPLAWIRDAIMEPTSAAPEPLRLSDASGTRVP